MTTIDTGYARPVATRGQTLLGGLMALLLVGMLIASTTVVLACAGLDRCSNGVAVETSQRALPGYGLRG